MMNAACPTACTSTDAAQLGGFPQEEDDDEPDAPPSGGGEPAQPDGYVGVDGEVPLIVLRAAGGNCRFTYGALGMTGA